ncbi:hypothetical protein HNV12_22440 [Methanococcoides sp. SA1]|nr:hypothetical protein [Methanococcoides sp. SA1]
MYTIYDFDEQEKQTYKESIDYWGTGKNGFFDISRNGIEIIWQGVSEYINKEVTENDEKWDNFNQAFKSFSFFHFYRSTFTLKSTFLLLFSGYYTEAAILLRNIVETFARLRFIENTKDTNWIDMAFSGHNWKKVKDKVDKSFKSKFNNQIIFESLSKGTYEDYRVLCDIAHGALASTHLKSIWESNKYKLVNGISFSEKNSSYIINQYIMYLYGHLNYITCIWPEILENAPKSYFEKYTRLIEHFDIIKTEFLKKDYNRDWFIRTNKLIHFK